MMSTSKNPANAFDDHARWGERALSGKSAALLRLCHALPNTPGMRRLALWLRHPLKHNLPANVDARIWNLRLRLMPRGNLSESRWLFLPQFVDHTEREFMRRELAEGGIFIDIGANAGLYSFWAAAVCMNDAGQVLAVEPDPELQRRMRFNRDTNDLDNLRIEECALGVGETEGRLISGGKNRGENRVADSANVDGDLAMGLSVPLRTLDGLLAERNIDRIDGLKIDIEGQEYAVMRHFFDHAPESLWPRFMIFETCTAAQAKSMQALAAEKGYSTAAKGRMNTVAKRTHSSESQK